MTRKDARGNLQYANYGITWNPFYYCRDGTGTNWQQNETKATGGPTAAHNNPPQRIPDPFINDIISYASSGSVLPLVPDLPYQERARCGGGEITGSEQSARQRATGHPTEERPLAHTHARTQGVSLAPLLAKGSRQSPRKGAWQPRRACTHATVNTNRCGVGLHAADTVHRKGVQNQPRCVPRGHFFRFRLHFPN